MLPEIKKRITSFLVGEEGRISKQALLAGGAFLGTGVLTAVLSVQDVSAVHTNELGLSYGGGQAVASHTHHANAPPTGCTPTGCIGCTDTTGCDTTGCAGCAGCY